MIKYSCSVLFLICVVGVAIGNDSSDDTALLKNLRRSMRQLQEMKSLNEEVKKKNSNRKKINKSKNRNNIMVDDKMFWGRILQDGSMTNSPTKSPNPTESPNNEPTKAPTKAPTKKENKGKISLGETTYFGSGCPDDSIEVTLNKSSKDSQTLSIFFSEYKASASGDNLNDQVNCQLAIPVEVNDDYKVGIQGVEYRGFTFVPEDENNNGAFSSLNTEFFFAGLAGPRAERVFNKAQVFTLTNDVDEDDIEYSECKPSNLIFRINTSIEANKNADGEDVEISIDSNDVAVDGKFEYRLSLQKC